MEKGYSCNWIPVREFKNGSILITWFLNKMAPLYMWNLVTVNMLVLHERFNWDRKENINLTVSFSNSNKCDYQRYFKNQWDTQDKLSGKVLAQMFSLKTSGDHFYIKEEWLWSFPSTLFPWGIRTRLVTMIRF